MNLDVEQVDKNVCSSASTNNITVRVEPSYVPKEEVEGSEEGKNYFRYRVVITNENSFSVKLISRYWLIINAEGESEEVEGPGVVGRYPYITPKESYSYHSYCALDTDWGTMEGFYIMMREDGSVFKAKISRFYLVKKQANSDL